MMYWNDYDFERYRDWLIVKGLQQRPVANAFHLLRTVREHADANSDGWAYWKLPARACSNLMTMFDKRVEPTYAELTRAITPIRAFYTRIRKKVPAYPAFPEWLGR